MVEIKDPNSLDSQAIDNRVLIIPAILILGIVGKSPGTPTSNAFLIFAFSDKGVVVFLLVKLQRAKIKVKEEKKKLKMERRERDRKKGR
jgi:hypothetical protein